MAQPRRALILIDVQNDYFDGPLAIQFPPRVSSLTQISTAIDAESALTLPIVEVRHILPAGAPVFAEDSEGAQLHPEIARRATPDWKQSTKSVASIFADTALVQWLRERDIDTVTLVGCMTNNCVIASAAAAEPLGFAVEVLSDATGAIHLANDAGSASAQQVHETLMTLLHSNFAAVATTDAWMKAAIEGAELTRSDLGSSAMQGRGLFGDAHA